MRFLYSVAPALALITAASAQAASSWGFNGATVSISGRGKDVSKEKLSPNAPLKKALPLEPKGSLKVMLTATEGDKAKRPHQAFLILKEPSTGVEAPFPFEMKETGRGVVEISQKNLPVQLLLATKPLNARVVIGSFGSSKPSETALFDISVNHDANAPIPSYEAPIRYGKQPEIHHIFKEGDKSPPKIISLVFVISVLATIPVLLITWFNLGANINQLQNALTTAPLSHVTFFGSIVAMEGVFFMYYTSWNLIKTLPAIAIVATSIFLSGTKALGEVQGRRLAGQR